MPPCKTSALLAMRHARGLTRNWGFGISPDEIHLDVVWLREQATFMI